VDKCAKSAIFWGGKMKFRNRKKNLRFSAPQEKEKKEVNNLL